ncbi:MAG: hypothetical protein ABSA83_22675 [Verrucomicrobiota bacterium]
MDEASTFNNDAGITLDGKVHSLPYATATTSTESTVSSTVTPAYSTSSLSVSFSQSTPDAQSVSSGEGTNYFTATGAADYSIAGSATMTGGPHIGGELALSLYDATTSTYLYQYDYGEGFPGSGSLALTADLSQNGSLTDSLTSGDVHELDALDALDNLQGAQTLTGTTTLSLTGSVNQVPEPATISLLATGSFNPPLLPK